VEIIRKMQKEKSLKKIYSTRTTDPEKLKIYMEAF
jgi:hypothetical protein